MRDGVPAFAAGAPSWFIDFRRATRAVNRAFAAAASLLALAILGVVLYDVAARSLAEPTLWAHDVARFGLLYLVFLSLAPALESGHHVAVDMFDRLLPAPLRRHRRHLASALCAVFGAVFLWQVARITLQAFADGRLAAAVITVPLKWIYLLGPIGVLQFVVTALAQLGDAQWSGERPAPA